MVTGDGAGVGEAAGDWGRIGERELELQPAKRRNEAERAMVVRQKVFMTDSFLAEGLAVMVVVVAVVLVDLAGDGADACAGSAAYDGSLEAAAEDGS